MANCASTCANHAVGDVVQKVGSLTATASTMLTYNIVASVGVTNVEVATRVCVVIVYLQEVSIHDLKHKR